MSGPGYWMYETSGRLRPAVCRYLDGKPITLEDIAIMRAYLRQWIDAPVWRGGTHLDVLRSQVNEITSRADIARWLGRAADIGLDPL